MPSAKPTHARNCCRRPTAKGSQNFSRSTRRRVALENHVPEPVLTLLFIVSVGAIGFIAYGCGLGGRRRFVSTAIFATLIALVLTFIRDIDQPQSGLILVSQESMIRLKSTLEGNPR